MRTLAESLRVHQWAKNALVAVPLLMAHRFRDASAWSAVAVAIACFCLIASGTYLFNDLLDLEADRAHPSKRNRPIASGRVPPRRAVLIASACYALGFLLAALLLPGMFTFCLVGYVALNALYSLVLKRKLMLDVLCLASLYTLRLLAGGVATGVELSFWLLAFSMFLFLNLAFVKRYAELTMSQAAGGSGSFGRGYVVGDLDLIRTLGPTSGYLAVLVFALYLNSPDVLKLYPRPVLLWGICPVLLYWVSRLWFVAARNGMHHDPVVFALTDKISYLVAAMILILAAAAIIAGR
ncbi:MAG: UbiA family prenyltransferase [Tepidisphaeraceae bacterium]